MISDSQNIASRYEQRRILLVSLILLGLLFVITAALARTYHAREAGLAMEWATEGNAVLEKGDAGQAIKDFRNSLSYGPEDLLVQLHLAEALLSVGRATEAHAYLVNLSEAAPGSGEVNLDLAHVSIKMGDVDQAIQYFHSAIFGSWENQPALQRRKARLELCELLLSRGRNSEAEVELAELAADTPGDDGALREENGRLFLRAGQPAKALAEFEAALRTNPQQTEWLSETGNVAFEDGEYLKAETYFSRADRENPSDEIHTSLALVRAVLGNDPFLAGLNDEEQSRRTLRDFAQGVERMGNCMGTVVNGTSAAQSSPDLMAMSKQLQDLQGRVSLASLGNDPELRNQAMRLVFQVEDVTAKTCGPPTGMDQALTLIEKQHEGSNP